MSNNSNGDRMNIENDNLPNASDERNDWIRSYIYKIESDTYTRVLYDIKMLNLLEDETQKRDLVAFIRRILSESTESIDITHFEKLICAYMWSKISQVELDEFPSETSA